MAKSIRYTFDLYFLQEHTTKNMITHVKNSNHGREHKENIVSVDLFSSTTNKKNGYLTLNYNGIKNGSNRIRIGHGHMVLKNKTIILPINGFESHNDKNDNHTLTEIITTTSTVLEDGKSNTYNTTIDFSYDGKEKHSVLVTIYNN